MKKMEKLQHGCLSTNLAICTALRTGDSSLAAGFIIEGTASSIEYISLWVFRSIFTRSASAVTPCVKTVSDKVVGHSLAELYLRK